MITKSNTQLIFYKGRYNVAICACGDKGRREQGDWLNGFEHNETGFNIYCEKCGMFVWIKVPTLKRNNQKDKSEFFVIEATL